MFFSDTKIKNYNLAYNEIYQINFLFQNYENIKLTKNLLTKKIII